jgi:hypothetical protein
MSHLSPPFYFAYGDNLSLGRMQALYPGSKYVGVARLRGYEWIININGHATIRPARHYHASFATAYGGDASWRDPNGGGASITHRPHTLECAVHNTVWGLVYMVTPNNKDSLDYNESAKHGRYASELRVEFWADDDRDMTEAGSLPYWPKPAMMPNALYWGCPGKRETMLVHIDPEYRTTIHRPHPEYQQVLNDGIADALVFGVPTRYVHEILRRYILPGASQLQDEQLWIAHMWEEQLRAEQQQADQWGRWGAWQTEENVRKWYLAKQRAESIGLWNVVRSAAWKISQHEAD